MNKTITLSMTLALLSACGLAPDSDQRVSAILSAAAAPEDIDVCEQALTGAVGDACVGLEWACAGVLEARACIAVASCKNGQVTSVQRRCADPSFDTGDTSGWIWDDCDLAMVAGRSGDSCEGGWACSELPDPPATEGRWRSVGCGTENGGLVVDEGDI